MFKDVYWIQISQECDPWRRLVNTVMDFDHKNTCGEFGNHWLFKSSLVLPNC